ncbi:hypothetical protein LC065_13560 [Halobacillus litoralis]|uniref:hypothetical protein n=1 Tax=Halobacillus litoralis TaxID=45668 RepID=UPI001CFEBA18|nr:hypothetical protein [Halobacillus litoralis]WLR46593.1 hypothetical protein LC065_13560 [Halobacillus litoralis]
MFHHSTYYTPQTETIMAHQSAQFSISDRENQRVATFEEDSSTSSHWLNHALKLFNLDQMASLHIKLLSYKQEVTAHIHRKKGSQAMSPFKRQILRSTSISKGWCHKKS